MKGTSILFSFAPSFHSMAISLCDNLILFSTINSDVTIGIFLPQIEKEHCQIDLDKDRLFSNRAIE